VTCPTKARVFGDINDPKSDAARLLKRNKAMRVVHPESDTDPNIYYLNATALRDWPVKAKITTPIQLWAKAAKPIIWALVGINALGVLVMLGKQFVMPDDEKKENNQGGWQK
jgi:tetrathionate reductase subunit B